MQRIQLTQGMSAVLDDADFERLSGFRWFYRGERAGKVGYAVRHGTKNDRTKTVYMHREIVKPPPGHEVIFLNQDRLDCRRDNLRAVTKEEARLHHHRTRTDRQPGHKGGVRYNLGPRTWSVDIFAKGRMMRLGTFETEEIATRAFDLAMRHYYPELCIAPAAVDGEAFGMGEEAVKSQAQCSHGTFELSRCDEKPVLYSAPAVLERRVGSLSAECVNAGTTA